MIGQVLGKIPGVPTKTSLGRRLIIRGYENELGDADVLGHVKTPEGEWERVPCYHQTELPDPWEERLSPQYKEDVETWYVPVDGSKPYPADGVGGMPGRLFGIPVAVGYRDFGEAREVPNTEISRMAFMPPRNGYDHENPVADPDVVEYDEPTLLEKVGDRVAESLPDAVEPTARQLSRWVADTAASVAGTVAAQAKERTKVIWDSESRARWCVRWGFALYRGKRFLRPGAAGDALELMQDPDGRWALERLEYRTDMNMYQSQATGKPADAEGIGCEPADMEGTPLSFGESGNPKLLAAIAPRIGRNLHEAKLVDDGEQIQEQSGRVYDYTGQTVMADGGTAQVNVSEAQPDRDDIIIEERAFVTPEDVRMIGGNQDMAEKWETFKDKVKASQHMPGDGTLNKMMDIGKVFMALIMGWWMGKQSGGGGGGGGIGGGSIPGLSTAVDPTVIAGYAMDMAAMGVA